MIIKQKSPSRPRNLALGSVLNKSRSAVPPLFNGPEVLSSASDKAKLFAKNFSKNSNLNDPGISLPTLPSRTNLKLYNISVTPKMVEKVITNLDLSKASRTNLKLHDISVTPKMVEKVITNLDLSKVSSPDCIPVAVLKNCEPELSYILAELFNECLKESCFPECWKVLNKQNLRFSSL